MTNKKKTYTINYQDLDWEKKIIIIIMTIKICFWHVDKSHDSVQKDFGKYSIDTCFEIDHTWIHTFETLFLWRHNAVIKLRVITVCGWNQFDLNTLFALGRGQCDKKSFFLFKYSEKTVKGIRKKSVFGNVHSEDGTRFANGKVPTDAIRFAIVIRRYCNLQLQLAALET